MDRRWYRGDGASPQEGTIVIPTSPLERDRAPEGYRADSALIDAVNVALFLGQPLLVTGEPGTGKTLLAYSVAHELGFPPPLKFETKSNSIARDLLYSFDAVARFTALQTGDGSRDPLDHLRFGALGLAILRGADEGTRARFQRIEPSAKEPRRSIVLIDEIDKAPRDFPNDLLNELEEMYFRIPEIENIRVGADASLRPIVIMTSNSEKNLPDAFLRRCTYYHIPFPDRGRLFEIVASRIGMQILGGREHVDDALEFFFRLRESGAGLVKKPSTSEFMAWIRALSTASMSAVRPLGRDLAKIEPTLSVLVKTAEDRAAARSLLEEWIDSPS
jgi:MoxR-like ATPase